MRRLNIKLLGSLLVGMIAFMLGVYVLHAAQVSKNADVTKKQADNRYAKGELDAALKLYDQYVKQATDDVEGYMLRAKTAVEIWELPSSTDRDRESAYRHLQSAAQQNPGDPFLCENMAKYEIAYSNKEMATRAKNNFEQALKGKPDDKSLAIKLAQTELRLKQKEKAFERLSTMVGYDAEKKQFQELKEPAPLAAYATLALLLRQYQEPPDPVGADAVIEQMLTLYPKDAQAHLTYSDWIKTVKVPKSDGKPPVNLEEKKAWEARMREEKKAWEARIRTVLDKAGELDKNDKNILLRRLEWAIETLDLKQADELAKQALDLHKTERRVYLLAARVKSGQKQPEQALEILKSGAQNLPKAFEIRFELTILLLNAGQIDEARKEIEIIRDLARESLNPFFNIRRDFLLSQLALRENKYQHAEGLLDRQRAALEAHAEEWQNSQIRQDFFKQLAWTYQALAGCYDHKAEWDRAMRNYELWRRADPSSSLSALSGIFRCLINLDRRDEALRNYHELRSKIGDEAFFSFVELWQPMFKVQLEQQSRLPPSKREWREVDDSLVQIRNHAKLTKFDLQSLEDQVLLVKGNDTESRKNLEEAVLVRSDNEQSWIGLVRLDLKEKGIDDAMATLDRAVKAVGDTVRLRLLRGDLLSRKNSPAARAEMVKLEKNLDQYKNNERVELLKSLSALYYYGWRDVSEAQRVMREVLKLDPSDTRVLKSLFDYARDKEDVAAVAEVGELMKQSLGPGSTDWKLVEGTRLFMAMSAAGKLDPKSQTIIRNLLLDIAAQRPHWHEADWLEANLLAFEGDADGYLRKLLDALKDGPPNPRLVQRATALLLEKGRIEEAEKTLKLVPAEQANAEMRQLNVELLLAKNEMAAALEAAQQALEPVKDQWRYQMWYGNVLTRAKKLEEAEVAFQKAVDLAPKEPDAHLALIEHWFRLTPDRALERAKEQMQKMERELPAERRAFALGIGYFVLGDYAMAEQQFREAKQAEPKNIGLYRAIAQFYLTKPDFRAKALRELEAMRRMEGTATDEPNKHWANRQLAQLKAQSGSYYQQEEALKLVDENKRDGVLSDQDILQKARILASRADSDSRRKAIDLLARNFVDAKKPLDLKDQLMLASLYEQVGNWDRSSSLIRSIASQPEFKQNLEVMTLYIKLLIKHDDLQSAAVWQDSLEKIHKNADVTKALRAQLLYRQGKQAAALDLLRKLKPDPVKADNAALAANVAELMTVMKFYPDADNLYQEYARVRPEAALVHADFLGKYTDLNSSLQICEGIIKRIDPGKNSRDWMKVMEVAIHTLRVRQSAATKEQYDKVAGWITRGRQANPDAVEFELKEAEFLELLGKYDQVLSTYRRILTLPVKSKDMTDGIDPELRAITLNNLAYLLTIADPPQPEEASKLIDEAITIFGPIRDLLDTRGMVRLARGDNKGALEDFNEVLLDHNSRDLEDRTFGMKYFHMALAQLRNGNLRGAEQSLVLVDRLKLTVEDFPFGERKLYKQLREEVEKRRKAEGETAKVDTPK